MMPTPLDYQKAVDALRDKVDKLEAREKRLTEALEDLSEGTTPWIDGCHAEPWEVMAAYAKKVLEGGE